jgi:putative FmdB family regulatory protein
MPVYEYECQKCGVRFEEMHKFSDPPVKKHNGCGGRVKKLLSAPAFQFKGSGWYITDYARKGNGGADKADNKDTAAKKTETSSDAAATGKKSEAKKTEPKEKAAKS